MYGNAHKINFFILIPAINSSLLYLNEDLSNNSMGQ